MWMRLAIYESTGKDKHKNQIIAYINYEQKLMSKLKKKQLIKKMK